MWKVHTVSPYCGRQALIRALLATCVCLALCSAQSWEELGRGSASGGGISGTPTASEYVTMALGPSGGAVLAWHDRGLRDVLVSTWAGAAWETLGEGAASPGGTDESLSCYPSLAVDAGGRAVLAWVQETSTLSFAVYVRRWEANAWAEVGAGSASAGGVSQSSGWALHPALAAVPDGRLVLVWQENTSGDDEIFVRQWTGSAWEDLGAGSAAGGGISQSAGRARYPAVAVDPDGMPVVAWLDDSSGAAEVFVRRWDGNAWVGVGAHSAADGGLSNTHGGVRDDAAPALAIALNGVIVVAWADDSGPNAEILVRRWTGQEWAEMGVDSASAGGISTSAGSSLRPALALTAGGTPVVAWQDDSVAATPQIRVKRWDGQEWVEAGAGSASGQGVSQTPGASRRPCIGIDPDTQTVTVAWDSVAAAGNTEVYVRHWQGGESSLDPPHVSLAGISVPRVGDREAGLTVTVTDERGVDAASLDEGDILVSGPGGFTQMARFVEYAPRARGAGQGLVVTYAVPAPGGAWDSADNGRYVVSLLANQITDTAGNRAEAGVLGSFDLQLADDPLPHTVIFDLGAHGQRQGGGELLQQVAHGQPAAAPIVQADLGWTFVGWDADFSSVTTDLLAVALFQVAGAVDPIGTFRASVSAPDAAAGQGFWDLSGQYELGLRGHALTLDLVHDTRGKVFGTGVFTTGGTASETIPVVTKGTAWGVRGAIVMTLSAVGRTPTAAVKVGLWLTLDAASLRLSGVAVLRGEVPGGTLAFAEPVVDLAVAPPMDGTWLLQFDLAQNARRVTGTAQLTLANTGIYGFAAEGTPRGESVSLTLTAGPDDVAAKGFRIRVAIQTLAGEQARIVRFSGRGLGQVIAW